MAFAELYVLSPLHTHTHTHTHVKFLITFIVQNTFVLNGDSMKKQILGIPMGTNCAPLLANLYLASIERTFIDGLWDTNPQRARRARFCFRLIDDILAVNCPFSARFLTDVYPKELVLERTNIGSDTKADFLGMHIQHEAGTSRLSIDIFDKRKEFNFQVCNYPHLDSVIPKSQAYGVFTGQLHRFNNICTDPKFNLEWAIARASYMVSNRGYSKLRLLEKFGAFGLEYTKFRGVKPRELLAMFKKGLDKALKSQ
jgi:hypothetical protein